MREQPVHLNDHMVPAKSKSFGCRGCRLFQYAPCFRKADRDEYQCTLDPHRKEKKNSSYKFESEGPDDAEVLVLLDHPTRNEDAANSAFSGREATNIIRNATASGIDTSNWRFTYLMRCRPPEGVKPSNSLAVYCSTFLVKEIQRLKPKIILTFGTVSLSAVLGKDTNIIHYVCQPQDAVVAGHTCVVYPMQSPSYIARNDFLVTKYLRQFEKMAGFLRGETGVLKDTSIKSVVKDPDDAIRVCQKLLLLAREGRTIEADLETSGLNPYRKGSRISVVSLGTSIKRGYALMINHNDCMWSEKDRARVIEQGLEPLLTHKSVKIRWHNGKFDVKWIRQHYKFWPRDQIEDTMLTHYAVDENVEHGLKPLALIYTDMGDYDAELERVLDAQTYPDAPRYDLVKASLLGKYAAMDVVATRKLALALRREVYDQDQFVHALAYRALPAFSATLTRLEHTGCHIDKDYGIAKLIPYLKVEAAKSYADILAQPVVRDFIRDSEKAKRDKMKRPKPIEVKKYFNFSLDSPNQLKTILYDPMYFGHEVTVFTEKGSPSTDKEALNDLAALGSPIARAIMDHRLDIKMCTTYGEPIIARLAEQGDDFLHGSFLMHGTRCVTGDTIVATEGGDVRIDDLLAGAPEGFSAPPVVRVWDGVGWRSPIASFVAHNADVIRVYTDDGGSIAGTPEHPLLTAAGWVRMDNLFIGCRLVRYDTNGEVYYCTVHDRKVESRQTVYDLTMEVTDAKETDTPAGVVPFVLEACGDHGDSRWEQAQGRDAAGLLRSLPDRGVVSGGSSGSPRRDDARDAQGPGDAREDTRCDLISADRTEEVGARAGRDQPERPSLERRVLEAARESRPRSGPPAPHHPSTDVRGPCVSPAGRGWRPAVLGRAPAGGVSARAKDSTAAQRDVLGGPCEQGARREARTGPEREWGDGVWQGDQQVRGGPAKHDAVRRDLHGGRTVVASTALRQEHQPRLPHPGEEGGDRGVRGTVASAGARSAAHPRVAERGYPVSRDLAGTVDTLACSGDPAHLQVRRICHAFVTNGYISHNTGRLSSKEPNLQNQPNKGNGCIKRLFDSRYGEDGVFLQVDFSQIELRILAAISGDPNMLEAYRLGKDLHTMTACMIFNMSEEEFNALPKDEQKRRRTVAKRVNFGIAYGIGAPGIMGTLKSDRVIVTEEEARGYLDSFYEKYPRVTSWIERVEKSTTDSEYSLSMFGRRRRLEAVRSQVDDVVARALRQGVNHVIQSTAGDMTMTALTLFDQETCLRAGRRPSQITPTIEARTFEKDARWKRVHPILQVHDMIGVDCHKDVAGDVCERLVDTMENVVKYAPLVWGDCVIPLLKKLNRVPIIAEPEVGPNWRDAVKIKHGSDIPRAMHIARIRQGICDKDLMHEWTSDDQKAAAATYKEAA